MLTLQCCWTIFAAPQSKQSRARKPGAVQTVKKVRNRQNRFTIQWVFALWILFAIVGYSKLYSLKTSLLRKDFDLLRNSRPTVPMYADGRELLVFRTFSQSVSVPKRVFRHAERSLGKNRGCASLMFTYLLSCFFFARTTAETKPIPATPSRQNHTVRFIESPVWTASSFFHCAT